jgi:L-fuconolactonase
MKIDSHQHFWQYDITRHQWITPQMRAIRHNFLPHDLINILKINGIEGTVAVQVDQTEQETNYLIELANDFSFIKGVVGWVDLQAEDIEARLEYYSNFPKLKGFRHIVQSETDSDFLLRPNFLNGISKLQQYNFTYDLLIVEKQLPAANAFVKKFPNQKFIIDHIAKPKINIGQLEPWANQIREIALNENVSCKLSGLVTENDWNLWNESDFRPYLDVVFEAFGVDRLVFGSDWPVCMLAASYGQVMEIIQNYFQQLSDAEKAQIWGKNAINFYGLKV